MEEARVRKPDADLKDYLCYNGDIFTLEEIANIHAEVPGHNDADHWYWIIELKDGRFLLTSAWCDYTGWDCQSGGSSQIAESAEAAAMLSPDGLDFSESRAIRRNLLAQLRGEQPFGIEVITPLPPEPLDASVQYPLRNLLPRKDWSASPWMYPSRRKEE